jgi:hypothetical protein
MERITPSRFELIVCSRATRWVTGERSPAPIYDPLRCIAGAVTTDWLMQVGSAAWKAAKQRMRSVNPSRRTAAVCHLLAGRISIRGTEASAAFKALQSLVLPVRSGKSVQPLERPLFFDVDRRSRPKGASGGCLGERPVHLGTGPSARPSRKSVGECGRSCVPTETTATNSRPNGRIRNSRTGGQPVAAIPNLVEADIRLTTSLLDRLSHARCQRNSRRTLALRRSVGELGKHLSWAFALGG